MNTSSLLNDKFELSASTIEYMKHNFNNPIMFITALGLPGTGKSTTANSIMSEMKMETLFTAGNAKVSGLTKGIDISRSVWNSNGVNHLMCDVEGMEESSQSVNTVLTSLMLSDCVLIVIRTSRTNETMHRIIKQALRMIGDSGIRPSFHFVNVLPGDDDYEMPIAEHINGITKQIPELIGTPITFTHLGSKRDAMAHKQSITSIIQAIESTRIKMKFDDRIDFFMNVFRNIKARRPIQITSALTPIVLKYVEGKILELENMVINELKPLFDNEVEHEILFRTISTKIRELINSNTQKIREFIKQVADEMKLSQSDINVDSLINDAKRSLSTKMLQRDYIDRIRSDVDRDRVSRLNVEIQKAINKGDRVKVRGDSKCSAHERHSDFVACAEHEGGYWFWFNKDTRRKVCDKGHELESFERVICSKTKEPLDGVELY